jgi:hypothetical protein
VIREFKKSGLSQADLAQRLGKGTDRVCKLMGGPGNWTLDTVSDLLFAIAGGESKYEISYPLDKPRRNYQPSEWLARNDHLLRAATPVPTANAAPSIDKFLSSGPAAPVASQQAITRLWNGTLNQ